MWFAISLIIFGTILGLAAAVYNLNDEKGRQQRIEQRRAKRKARKRLW